MSSFQRHAVLIGNTEFEHPDLKNENVKLWVYLSCVKFDNDKITKDFGETAQHLKNYLAAFNKQALADLVAKTPEVNINLDGKKHTLKYREHFFLNGKDRLW